MIYSNDDSSSGTPTTIIQTFIFNVKVKILWAKSLFSAKSSIFEITNFVSSFTYLVYMCAHMVRYMERVSSALV